MADPILKPVTGMAPAATLTGAELVPLVQGGANVRATAQAIASLAATAAPFAGEVPLPIISASGWTFLNALNAGALASRAGVQFVSEYYPFHVNRTISITTVGIQVVTGAASTTEVAIYGALASGKPGAKLASRTFTDTSSPGLQQGAMAVTLAPGFYWIGFGTNSSALVLRSLAVGSVAAIEADPASTIPRPTVTGGNGLNDPATSTLALSTLAPMAIYFKYS